MNINAAFPSSYLKAADLQGRAVRVQIADCVIQPLDDGDKPLLTFAGKDRGLILNKTNGGLLAAALGDETDHWRGKTVEIYPDRVMFQGRMVECIRVRVPQDSPAPAMAPAQAASFAAQAPAPAPDFDDSIPF